MTYQQPPPQNFSQFQGANISAVLSVANKTEFEPIFNAEEVKALSSNAEPNQSVNSAMNHIKSNVSKKLLSDTNVLSQMQGEFSIVKGYGGD